MMSSLKLLIESYFPFVGITLSVVAVVIVGCTVIVILLVLLRIFSLKRRREEVASDELAKPESVEIPDNVNCE